MTVHAVEEMAEDDLDIFDIEQAILKRTSRTKKQKKTLAELNTQSKALP